ncbi:MAG: CPBP family glutamic-type intramembrane protease [Prevotella sp.]|nr:CPBP family glutamic-type intramembrane protease [Prevotella sp.]
MNNLAVNSIKNTELRPFWNRIFSFNWKFGLFLILIVCIPRFILVLNANASGSYGAIGLIMTLSAIVPFFFLSKYGQKEIGITKPQKSNWLLIAFVCGLIASLFLYFLGQILYGNSYENWYEYIGKSYKIPTSISPNDKKILFVIMAITGMTFSPIGEELFFRGIVHSSFAKSIGEKKASIVDSSAFAITHISHFGLVFINNNWGFFTIPTIIWVLSMFLMSILFFTFKKHSGSLLGAIICHSAFNLGMIYSIFYLM